jgi:hypothetical protein
MTNKTAVSQTLTLTGTSGTIPLTYDFSNVTAGEFFISGSMSFVAGQQILLGIDAVDPTTDATMLDLTVWTAAPFSPAGVTTAVELTSACNNLYAASYTVAWTTSPSNALSGQEFVVTFVPAPGAVTVTINE